MMLLHLVQSPLWDLPLYMTRSFEPIMGISFSDLVWSLNSYPALTVRGMEKRGKLSIDGDYLNVIFFTQTGF